MPLKGLKHEQGGSNIYGGKNFNWTEVFLKGGKVLHMQTTHNSPVNYSTNLYAYF